MSRLDAYRDRFPNRSPGALGKGCAGSALVFDGYAKEQFVYLFHNVGADLDNRVVIPTGSQRDRVS
jgi:hypothetical protein